MSNDRAFSDRSFRQFLSEEKLMGCRCRKCGNGYLPPKPICTNCFSRDLEWVEMPETGTLAAFTWITVGPPAMRQEGYGRKNPYCSGVIELADDLRVDARIQGLDPKRPEIVRIGMPMRIDFIHQERDGAKWTLLGFRP
ncbi:Zn-ribbon domain-containing OB-fold protein, partial [Desulfosarcina sp.]|uniref:Zn-ribbon domain-containing OB-fold protein n=1 Tax=Desulfosarcina sp. TaxID=2027861 RepID=UPI0035644F80